VLAREDGSFDVEVPVPAGRSEHRLSFRGAGDFSAFERTFTLVGASAPRVEVLAPAPGAPIRRDSCRLRVQADRPLASAAADLIPLAVNGTCAEGDVPLAVAVNKIRVALVDQHGRSAEQVVELTRRPAPRVEIESPAPARRSRRRS
jgi:hypothetical protein